MVLDVADRAAMAGAAAEMKARFGGVDILCNNAGIGPLSPMYGDGYEFWDRIMAVNTGGVINGIVSFVPDMVARGRGHIINTASFGGVMPASGLFGIYTTSKFAVVGLSSALRDSLAGSGVSVSALCPGLVATNLAVNARQSGHSQVAEAQGFDEQAEKILATGIPSLECGRMVIAGIRKDAPFIFTHGELRRQVAEHFDMILSCFPAVESTSAESGKDLPFFHSAAQTLKG